MKKRIIATTTLLSLLLALFMFAPGNIAIANEINPLDNSQPRPETTPIESPIALASSTISNTNPGEEVIHLYLTFVNVSRDIWLNGNVRITVTGFRSSEIMLADGALFTAEIEPQWLNPGYQATVSFPIIVSRHLTTSSDLNVEIRGRTADGEFEHNENAQIIIARPDPPPDPEPPTPIPPSVPRVIISRQQMSVDSVIAGNPFDLTITLLNTSRNRNVRNMVVTITDAEGVFVPVVGVNSFFIEALNAQETTEIVISLMARQDTETGSHPITVTINYEDTLNAPHSTAPTINIPVYMPVRLETRSMSFEDEGGGSAFLSFQIVNMSLAPLSNVTVRLEGPFVADQFQEFFFGTINSGAFEFFEDTIFPFEFGEVSGEIVIEFEDSSGAPGELRIPISTWVGEPFFPEFPESGDRWPSDGDFGWEEEAVNEAPPWWLWIAIGGGVLLAGIITIVVVRRVKRKKKEAEDFDE